MSDVDRDGFRNSRASISGEKSVERPRESRVFLRLVCRAADNGAPVRLGREDEDSSPVPLIRGVSPGAWRPDRKARRASLLGQVCDEPTREVRDEPRREAECPARQAVVSQRGQVTSQGGEAPDDVGRGAHRAATAGHSAYSIRVGRKRISSTWRYRTGLPSFFAGTKRQASAAWTRTSS